MLKCDDLASGTGHRPSHDESALDGQAFSGLVTWTAASIAAPTGLYLRSIVIFDIRRPNIVAIVSAIQVHPQICEDATLSFRHDFMLLKPRGLPRVWYGREALDEARIHIH